MPALRPREKLVDVLPEIERDVLVREASEVLPREARLAELRRGGVLELSRALDLRRLGLPMVGVGARSGLLVGQAAATKRSIRHGLGRSRAPIRRNTCARRAAV